MVRSLNNLDDEKTPISSMFKGKAKKSRTYFMEKWAELFPGEGKLPPYKYFSFSYLRFKETPSPN